MARTITDNQKGQKQELSDIVKNIAPVETPFQSIIGTSKTGNKLFSWTEETLSPVGENAAAEGADAPNGVDNILSEFQNYTQIFTKTVDLSGTSQANKLAGNTQTLAHQVELRAREIKRDIEYAYVGTGQVAVATGTRKTAGFQALAGLTVDSTGKLLNADALDDYLLTLDEQGATPDVIMAHPRVIAALARRLDAQRTRDMGESTKFNSKVIKYLSNAGEVELHMNRFVRYDAGNQVGDVLIFDSSMWTERVLRPYKIEELAKTGDADRRQLIVEKGLMCLVPKSALVVTNVGIE